METNITIGGLPVDFAQAWKAMPINERRKLMCHVIKVYTRLVPLDLSDETLKRINEYQVVDYFRIREIMQQELEKLAKPLDEKIHILEKRMDNYESQSS